MRYHYTPIKMAIKWLKLKTLTKPNVAEDADEINFHTLLTRMKSGTNNL